MSPNSLNSKWLMSYHSESATRSFLGDAVLLLLRHLSRKPLKYLLAKVPSFFWMQPDWAEEPDEWKERGMAGVMRWLAPGVRSHRWARHPSATGGVLQDRAWRSPWMCACVCARAHVWHCQSLLQGNCRSMRKTWMRIEIVHLVTLS